MGFKGIDNQEVKVDVKNTNASRDAMKRLFDVYLKTVSAEEKAEIDRELASLKQTQEKEIAGVVAHFSAEQKKLYQEITQGFLYNVKSSIESIPVDAMHKRVAEILDPVNQQGSNIEMNADFVLPLQLALCRWKHGIVKVDGIYGPEFKNALMHYQEEVLKDKTPGVKKGTFVSLNTFLDPSWNPNVTATVNRQIEKEEMHNIAPDKLQNTGDNLFKQSRTEDAVNYYNTAAVKRSNTPQNLDWSAYDRLEKNLDEMTVTAIKKYINAANNMMDDALKFPNPRAEYKINIYNEAAKLLVLAWNIDPYACNILLRNRKRIDNQAVHNAEEAARVMKNAEDNLARVKQSLNDAKYGKIIDANTRTERRLPPQPDKVAVWEKQIKYREGELAKAKQFNNSFDRVIYDQNTPEGNTTTIRAYLDNYLGPIPRDLPSTPEWDKAPNVTYRTMTEEQRRRFRSGNPAPIIRTTRGTVDVTPPAPQAPQAPEIAVVSNNEETLPRNYAERNFLAIKFLEKYFVNGQEIMDACNRLPLGKISYTTQRGDTALGVAQMAGITRFILATQNSDINGEDLEPGRVLDVTPQRDAPAQIKLMRSRIMMMKIADPFMKLFDKYGKNDKNPQFIAQCKELSAHTKIKLPDGEYKLVFRETN